jgi:hypothetical protein
MFFEFHLKIKGGDATYEDFCKGFIEHSAIRHTQQPTIRSLESCLSRMELVYTPVRCALEAFIAVRPCLDTRFHLKFYYKKEDFPSHQNADTCMEY